MKANSTRYSHRESKLDRTLFTEGLGDLLASLHGEGPLAKNAPRCPPLIGQGPPAHLSGAGPQPVRRPQLLLYVASLSTSNSVSAAKIIVQELQRSWEPRTGTARPPLGKSRYEQPAGGDGA